jgi:GntR family transcriptional regulator, rspAB operon transcriptional repressor
LSLTPQADDGASDEARSNVDAVYEKLRRAILDGESPPGSRLSQVQLAQQFDVSRGPLREALRLLERDGLVVTEHQRMVRVSPVSFSDLDELYALRIVNEGLALHQSVPSMTAADIALLQGHVGGMVDATRSDDWFAWSDHHRAFHAGLYSGVGERTARMLGELFDHADRYRRVYHHDDRQAADVAEREHREILEACAAGDREQSAVLLARHLARSALMLLAHAAPEHEPVLVREAMRFAIRPLTPALPKTATRSN